ncbi:iron ABC transporter permease [uncultured Piscinibacter sp.]|uniref:FecCD family ABC transporter permease n=1 Tax=uncultured Piscinibacter sp. TaxID=1131835 RepID=UPI0026066A08|nr:iron ABC transporter permease [uncultured Piscinibacter sp.]
MARALRLWLLLAVAAAAAGLLALASGSVLLPPAELLHLLLQPDGSSAALVLHGLRLPRALAAFGVGGLLAVAGALMQVLLRNPLADPYVLGVSGGASVGALLALLIAGSAWLVQAGAFAGALLTIVLVFALAQRDLSRLDTTARLDSAPRLLLTGVMLAALWSAVITLMLMLAPEARLRGMLFWLAGDLGGSEAAGWPIVVLGGLLLLSWPLARELNVLLGGAASAQALGVPVVRLRRHVYVLASLATAIAVTTGGAIGFVGLVVPHALRLLMGNDQRTLLPACALAGGTLLLLADTLARTVVAPQQLPVGVITALLGVPTFIVLLLHRGGRR